MNKFKSQDKRKRNQCTKPPVYYFAVVGPLRNESDYLKEFEFFKKNELHDRSIDLYRSLYLHERLRFHHYYWHAFDILSKNMNFYSFSAAKLKRRWKNHYVNNKRAFPKKLSKVKGFAYWLAIYYFFILSGFMTYIVYSNFDNINLYTFRSLYNRRKKTNEIQEEKSPELDSEIEEKIADDLEQKDKATYDRSFRKTVKKLRGQIAMSEKFETSTFQMNIAKNIKDRLSDLKGINEVREEIEDLIKMIKDPSIYVNAGAKVHKGILLCGPPGVGKTMIARCIAGESNVNFMYVSGSDFDDTYVGVGMRRMKELFKKARDNKPCIIFMDEIDSLLSKSRRGGAEHSSVRSTLNQFLAEMDGFSKLEGVYIIGATNHEKDLDTAAVRPGRFDKTIHVSVPSEEGRIEIIGHYLQKAKIKKNSLDPKTIASMTPGFSGADIENLINLTLISCIKAKKDYIEIEDVSEARDRVMMGIARKNVSIPEKRRFKTALHEAGHALVCYKNEHCRKKLHKLTVIPRGSAEGVVN